MVRRKSQQQLAVVHPFVDLVGIEGVHDVEYTACMVGGSRDKRQRLRTNVTSIDELHGTKCDGKHEHRPWRDGPRQWHSAEEAEYPNKFCDVIASYFSKPAEVRHVHETAAQSAKGALAAAKRPRRKGDAWPGRSASGSGSSCTGRRPSCPTR